MKVCLIFPPVYLTLKEVSICPPLGIYIIASKLREKGHEATIIPNSVLVNETKDKEKLLAEGYINNKCFKNEVINSDVLALSCDSFNYCVGKILDKKKKKINPNIKVIVGGIHASLAEEWIIQNRDIDIVMRGEGEYLINELMDYFENGDISLQDIDGITYLDLNGNIVKNKERELLETEDLYSYSKDLFDEKDIKEYLYFPVETSRGCPYNCGFCSVLNKRKWRMIPTEVVKENIAWLSGKTKLISFVDDAFTIDEERAIDILHYVNEMDGDMVIEFEARVNNLNKSHLFENINPSRIKKIQIGAECGYDEGLKKIGKGITIEDIELACKKAEQSGVSDKMLASFIIGFPWETAKEMLQTIEFAEMLMKKYHIKAVVNWWIPIPSKLWNEFKLAGKCDESMFDELDWIETSFPTFHPQISDSLKNKINFLLFAMK